MSRLLPSPKFGQDLDRTVLALHRTSHLMCGLGTCMYGSACPHSLHCCDHIHVFYSALTLRMRSELKSCLLRHTNWSRNWLVGCVCVVDIAELNYTVTHSERQRHLSEAAIISYPISRQPHSLTFSPRVLWCFIAASL